MKLADTYRTLFNTLKDIIIVQELIEDEGEIINYRILDVNPAFEIIFRIPRKKAVGQLASDVFEIIPPLFIDKYIRVFQTRSSSRFETYLKSIAKHLLVSVYPEQDKRLVTTAVDISDYVHQKGQGSILSNRLIPICANCKKIRDDDNHWQQIEEFITKHTNAQFTHGICPDCMQILYPGIDITEKPETDKK